ncbi:hypothetical protein FJZ31_04920 [Candidatus Poribacteria bacterium]|nr:hypothetical protein [Candidatus Poribacteria bacterium]
MMMSKLATIFLFLLIVGIALTVFGQDIERHLQEAYFEVGKADYIKEWLVLGPFFPNNLEKDFLSDIGGEANVNPKAGDTVTTADGRTLTWKRYQSQTEVVDLLDAVGRYDYATAYAFCLLQTETAFDAKITLRSDDGITIWLEGIQVYSYPTWRPLSADSDTFVTHLQAGTNRCLVKVSDLTYPLDLAMRVEMRVERLLSPERAVLLGTINDESGQPIPYAVLRLEENGKDIAQTQTDVEGNYCLSVYPVRGPYDLSVTAGELGAWQLDLHLREQENQRLDLTLKEAISLSGAVLASDNTPQVSVPVHAIALDEREGGDKGKLKIIVTALTAENGQYRFINLKPGLYQILCKLPGGEISPLSWSKVEATPLSLDARESESIILPIEHGTTLKNIDFRFVPFKKRTPKADESPTAPPLPTTIPPLRPLLEAQTYTARGGANAMQSAIADAQGYTWFSTSEPSWTHFYRFDGKRFTVIDNTIGSGVKSSARDAEGKVWIAGQNGVVRLWNGEVEKHYTVPDGLPSNAVIDLQADKHKGIWVMTTGGISYIHKENGDDKMSLVVDATRLNLSGIEIDSAGSVWWWATGPLDVTTTVHRLLKTSRGISEALKIQLPFRTVTASAVGEGLLVQGENLPFIYYRSDGVGYALDRRLFRYFATDKKDRLYFAAEAEDEQMQIIRDAPDSEGDFGYPGSPN